MSFYICRRCARGPSRIPASIPTLSSRSSIAPTALASSHANRSFSAQVAHKPSASTSNTTTSTTASTAQSNTSASSRTLGASKSQWHVPASTTTTTTTTTTTPGKQHRLSQSTTSTTSSKAAISNGDKAISSYLYIRNAQRRIDQLAHNLEVDALYLQFWRICQKATIEEQRRIWAGNYRRDNPSSIPSNNSVINNGRSGDRRQESLYRAFNSSAKPKSSSPPKPLQDTLRIPYDKPTTTTKSETNSTIATTTRSIFTLNFLGQSHAKRLLQMHQYFEQVLGIPTGYNARIALLVAFSSRGDVITALNLFRQWQQQPVHNTHASTAGRSVPRGGGKEMYSAVIRALIGRNFQDSEGRSFYVQDDPAAGVRNQGITQVYTALELFYDLLRQGGKPGFEIYHSLIVGLSTFKNDMEAAELLLDHMIVMKKKPYVQVLHVMCREYARRKDFVSVERIFGMLKEYGIQPRTVTCNIMLRAIFQMSTLEALQYLGHTTQESKQDLGQQQSPGQEKDFDAIAEHLKRQKIHDLREYMYENGTIPNEQTFSTLCYGFGHMRSGFLDLQDVMAEIFQGPSAVEPNLVILSSLLFAHLNHGKVRRAESILDQIMQSFHPLQESSVYAHTTRPRKQMESPFRKQNSKSMVTNPVLKERDTDIDVDIPRIPMVPGKGAFHALMLAYVEQRDTTSMERIVDKMIQAQCQQRDQYYQWREDARLYRSKVQSRLFSESSATHHRRLRAPPMVNLEADEYTATIMLLGYLSQRDFAKVDLIQQQIRAHPEWRSSSLFLDRDEGRQELIDFVRHQSSREVTRRSLMQGEEEEEEEVDEGQGSNGHGSKAVATTVKPLSGDLQGELDDDIEIDVTTLSAKLRGLMNSSPSAPSSSQTK
ncbi:hypothetical protein EC991_003074 [Linnemannia zychae]|nr:hypothetical protein EC991_003074 [Linnemannia zychae]